MTQIKGSYSAVVGLPLYETAKLLAELDYPTPIQDPITTISNGDI